MKYLLIFLPIFCFARGGDNALYGFRTQSNTRLDSGFISYQQLYIEGRTFEVIESFKYNGAYYELRKNGWYKEISPDTLPKYGLGEQIGDTCWCALGNLRILKPGCATETGVSVRWETIWTPCEQHFGEVDHPKRDKIEQSEVKLLIWNGCALAEVKATKFYGYNYDSDAYYVEKGTMKRVQKDFIAWYLAGDKWIKSSHVIKEL